MEDVEFLIVAGGYNCPLKVRKCYESILSQTYRNFRAILIDDGSEPETKNELIDLNNQDIRVEINAYFENKGAAFRRYEAINEYGYNEETVIVLLGLDDALFPNALSRIKKEYDKGVWMTYGNWIGHDNYKLPEGFLNFDEETHKNRDYRKVLYRSTAPNTFKRFLFDRIPQDDFKVNGKWMDSTTESELMFSCLEMSGKDRIGVIEQPIYLYNRNLPNGSLARLGKEYKYKILDEVIKRPKKDQLFR